MKNQFTILVENEKGEERALAVEAVRSRELMDELKTYISDDEHIVSVHAMHNKRIAQFAADTYNEMREDSESLQLDIDEHIKRVTEIERYEYVRHDPMPDTEILCDKMSDEEKERLDELDINIEQKLHEIRDMLKEYVDDGTYVEDIDAVIDFYRMISSEFINIY